MIENSLLAGAFTALAALVAVVAALLLVGRAARAAGLGARPGRRLALEEALALDGRRRLLLLRCDGRPLLVMTGGAQDLVVGWMPPAETPAPRDAGQRSPTLVAQGSDRMAS